MNGRRQPQSRTLILFILFLVCLLVLSGLQASGALKQAKARQTSGVHFSPVLNEEKTLFGRINQYRLQNHLSKLKADWDLFRYARLEAKKMAAGEIRSLNDQKLNALLSGIGRSGMHVHSLIVPAQSGKKFTDPAWWSDPAIQRFAGSDSVSLLGTGHASGAAGEFWILLTAQEP